MAAFVVAAQWTMTREAPDARISPKVIFCWGFMLDFAKIPLLV
jgi:hypothetical protein